MAGNDDLIRQLMAQSGAGGGFKLAVPEGMGDFRDKFAAMPYQPGYVPGSMADIVPKDPGGGGGEQQPRLRLPDDRAPPLPAAPAYKPEGMFDLDTALKVQAPPDSRDAAIKKAREALERAGAAAKTPPAPPAATPVLPAETPSQFEGQNTQNPGGKVDQAAFLKQIIPYALEVSKQTGIDPRLVIAQAAHESGWGNAAPGFNYFGIKAGANEPGQELATKEMVDGKLVPTKARFRTYANPQESFKHYAEKMKTTFPGVVAAKSLQEQIIALGKSGYATDSNYLPALAKIIAQLPPEVVAQLTAPAAEPEPDTRARGGPIHDLLATARNYR
jgi:flagellum-specific peptidoglycan hydrolase FlgJ